MERIVIRGAKNASGSWTLEQDGAMIAVVDSQDAAIRAINVRARAQPELSSGHLVIFHDDDSFESETTFDDWPCRLVAETRHH